MTDTAMVPCKSGGVNGLVIQMTSGIRDTATGTPRSLPVPLAADPVCEASNGSETLIQLHAMGAPAQGACREPSSPSALGQTICPGRCTGKGPAPGVRVPSPAVRNEGCQPLAGESGCMPHTHVAAGA